jgi:hypothetical protein
MPSQKSALTELQGSVRVLNHTTQPLALSADGSPVGTLFSGDDARVDALAPGPVRLMAESADGSMRFATTLEVRPGHLPQWNVDEPAAVAEFVNLTDEALRIEAGEQVLNRLAPGDRVLLEGLEAGTLSCTAQCLRSHSVLAAELSLESGAVTRWVITRDPSTAVVQNPTSEFVRVSVNGKERVRIPPQGITTLQGLPPGPTTLQALGETSGGTTEVALSLEEGELIHWDARIEWAELVVFNQSSEPLTPDIHLARQHRDVPPGETRTFILRAGPRKLQMTGVQTQTEHVQELIMSARTRLEWTIEEPTGALLVQNHRKEQIRVEIGDDLFAVVEGETDALVAPLPVGRVHLRATGLTTRWSETLATVLRPNRPIPWLLQHTPAGLRVVNDTPEEVAIYVNGSFHGELSLGETGHYGPIPAALPGEPDRSYRATAIGIDTGTRHASDIIATEGQVAPWRLHLPDGALLVRNLSGDAMRVHVSGQDPSVVPPGGEEVRLVAAHPQLVEAEGPEGKRTTSIQPLPGQTHQLDLLPDTGTIVVDNVTQTPVQITWNETHLGTIQASHRALLRDLPLGRITLVASTSESNQTWHLTHRVVPDAILYWRINTSHPAVKE